ncbi:SprT family zinc-dependent metalloprotease [Gallibacterium salpingitidis]|uniref:Protein SprT n=1 Tax=Gallibacterium salpingitidis TaxID=505341 RepID=A0A1A7NQF4_9PAST|nr:SprT family zinc-dependent metalloprotease [Gallibacterium salpingitidis]OBW91863.1 sprT [Gallibacterium salpingitidis]
MTTSQLRYLHLQVNRKLTACLQTAEKFFQCQFARPTISYKLRGMKAGVAYLQQWEIRLNPTLLLENQQAFIDEVVPHELAHLLVYKQFGRVQPHGKEWQMVMNKVFKLEARTRHQFAVESVQGETYPYRCACQLHHLTKRRHNKILREGVEYFCKKCKTKLQIAKLENEATKF